MFRASSMSRVLACPYSETIKHERDESSDAAKWGQEVHKWMETCGGYRPGPVGEYDWSKKEKYCKNLDEVAAEAFGWGDPLMRYEVNVYRYINGVNDICDDDNDWPLIRSHDHVMLSGTIDMLKFDEEAGLVTIRDLKTGTVCPDVNNNKQLLSYAACAPLPDEAPWTYSLEILHWPYEPFKGLPVLTKWQVDDSVIDAFVGEVKAAKNDIDNNRWALSPNVGEHCAFCPGKKNCEGWK